MCQCLAKLVSCTPARTKIAMEVRFDPELSWSFLILTHLEPTNVLAARNIAECLLICGLKKEANLQQRLITGLLTPCHV